MFTQCSFLVWDMLRAITLKVEGTRALPASLQIDCKKAKMSTRNINDNVTIFRLKFSRTHTDQDLYEVLYAL